jgi:hypothetical protein
LFWLSASSIARRVTQRLVASIGGDMNRSRNETPLQICCGEKEVALGYRCIAGLLGLLALACSQSSPAAESQSGKAAEVLKRGNSLLENSDFDAAISAYTKAIHVAHVQVADDDDGMIVVQGNSPGQRIVPL